MIAFKSFLGFLNSKAAKKQVVHRALSCPQRIFVVSLIMFMLRETVSVLSFWPFVMYSIYESVRAILLIESTNSMILLCSLKFSRGKHFMVLPKSAQKQIFTIKFLCSSFQPCLASVMNLKFCRRKFHSCALTCEIHENIQP